MPQDSQAQNLCSVPGSRRSGNVPVRHIHSHVGSVAGKGLHWQASPLDHVRLADIYHCTPVGNAAPSFFQQVTAERIEDDINAFVIRSSHDVCCEVSRPGVVDSVRADAVVLDQEIPFLLSTHSSEYL